MAFAQYNQQQQGGFGGGYQQGGVGDFCGGGGGGGFQNQQQQILTYNQPAVYVFWVYIATIRAAFLFCFFTFFVRSFFRIVSI